MVHRRSIHRFVRVEITRSWALTTLAVLAVFYTLYIASELLLPLVLAALFATLFAPVDAWLRRRGLPRALAAFVLVFGLTGLILLGALLLTEPAAEWLQKAPQLITELQRKIYPLAQKLEEMTRAAQEVERMAGGGRSDDQAQPVQLQGFSLRDIVIERAQTLIVSGVMLIFLLYFMLATGDRLLRNAVRSLPSWRSKRRMLVVARQLQQEISRYLLTFTAINAVLGLLVSALTWAFGLPNPLLWGVVAGLLNFIPYLGPAVTLAILTVVSTLSLEQTGQIVMVPLIFLLITSLEGQLVTPTILGRQLALNPIFIFAGLIFWGWLWGVTGALLAVPIMVSVKIICDHVRPLRPIGVILGR